VIEALKAICERKGVIWQANAYDDAHSVWLALRSKIETGTSEFNTSTTTLTTAEYQREIAEMGQFLRDNSALTRLKNTFIE
jgi:hypothetical protein